MMSSHTYMVSKCMELYTGLVKLMYRDVLRVYDVHAHLTYNVWAGLAAAVLCRPGLTAQSIFSVVHIAGGGTLACGYRVLDSTAIHAGC